jgi:hypothetical protein
MQACKYQQTIKRMGAGFADSAECRWTGEADLFIWRAERLERLLNHHGYPMTAAEIETHRAQLCECHQ